MPTQVLLIEDDGKLASRLKEYLATHDMKVAWAPDGAAGLREVSSHPPDVVLLDVMLPGMDGFEICKQIRRSSRVPILMLTARGEEADRIVGLEIGADDYLPKPFSPRELVARIRAVLRRLQPADDEGPLAFGKIVIDPGGRRVQKDGREVQLTAYQFDLLHTLASRPGRVYTRDELSELTKGSQLGVNDRSIDVHVSRIRALIEDDPKRPRYVKTLRSAGYVFVKDPGEDDA
ncbi:MAG: response regulator transcription factor [Acidobacteriota bacterium]